jgi:hypothetical protein
VRATASPIQHGSSSNCQPIGLSNLESCAYGFHAAGNRSVQCCVSASAGLEVATTEKCAALPLYASRDAAYLGRPFQTGATNSWLSPRHNLRRSRTDAVEPKQALAAFA